MTFNLVSPFLSVSAQLSPADLGAVAAGGFRTVICNRPDGEEPTQPTMAEMAAAAHRLGLRFESLPVVSGKIADDDIRQFRELLSSVDGPVLAYCRTGTRSISLWGLTEAKHLTSDAILRAAKAAGYDLSGLEERIIVASARSGTQPGEKTSHRPIYDVVIVGGGAGGLSTASSLLKRRHDLDIAVIEPREHHYYQPGWTLVGGGVFDRKQTVKAMSEVLPYGVTWLQAAVADFIPDKHEVVLEDGSRIGYRTLVASPGIKLDWDAIPGLRETLGHNGVTSNYLFDMAPYTWALVQGLKGGDALFTQPPMPIKCAGAPQKAMYLACDAWRRRGIQKNLNVEFHTAGPTLFGIADYVPALMEYVDRYDINLQLQSRLIEVDGPARRATFASKSIDGTEQRDDRGFDMIHVCPPQTAPDFIKSSPLANTMGFVDVDQETMRHSRYGNVFGLGDACSSPNAKTAAAVRKQAPVVAHNVLATLDGKPLTAVYDGYGSCPLTVERGKIVLAEFGYGGKLQPTFPNWLLDGSRPSRAAWFLKEKLLPPIYWQAMLKGREWLAAPQILRHSPTPHDPTPGPCDGVPVRGN